ncbi:addiction module protein [Prosthecobacter dejongeii]|uniref:Putative addiction module component (TIGR02574 family) n=1 Tax=Prosthecobacter dejongeii TaxID=48465 RepID=A0A7W8DSU5_9BACT|nr:addiction module protein [Prosthecobacter dejongeii]MBB5040206.1 putative addiction module component (TIGR02574 family) [Prosthecobacter dejongeii]
MTLAEFSQVRALPMREKLLLVDEIWESMVDVESELEVLDAEKRELNARWERFEKDPLSALTLEEFQARINAKRG